MSDVFSITVPLFIVIGLGFVAARSRLLGVTEFRALGTFVLYVGLPALIVRAFSQRALAELFNAAYLLAYGLASLAVFSIGLIAMRLLGQPRAAGAIAALGMACSNTGYIGYPLAALVVGPVAAVALALNMLVESLLVIPLALALAESAGQGGLGWRRTVMETSARLLRSPLILAILCGVLLALSGWHLPLPLARTVDLLAPAAGPVALFAIGGVLHGADMQGLAKPLSVVVAGKLLLMPLAVALALQLFPVADASLATAGVLIAGVPMLAIYPVLGQRFGLERLCAAALLCSVLLSFGTVNLLLVWLRHGG